MRPTRSLALLPLVFCLSLPATGRSNQTAGLSLKPCQVPGLARDARCGTLEVFENRKLRKGRKISLKVVVVPATGQERLPEAFTFLHGGPGSPATELAGPLAAEYAEINANRDILLVDQRGTGGSNPLDIDLYGPPEDLRAKLGEFIPPKKACEGAAQLKRSNDLTQYTTPIAMDDLDDVRAALGYQKLNVFGGSYGTRAAMAYLRQHPDRVRTLVLAGVSRFNDHLPLHSPINAQRALDGLIAECERDDACRTAFPEIGKEIRQAIARLESGPVEAQVLHPASGEVVTLPLTQEVAAEALRYMLYAPSLAIQIPAVMHQAAKGDWGPLTEMALFGRLSIIGSTGHGMFLAVMCSEDVSNIDAAEGEKLAAGTFMGPARLRQLKEACRCFPKGYLPAGYEKPVRSSVPALIISGGLDPATPPSNGDAVAGFLPNARHVVIPGAGHDTDGMKNAECVSRLITAVVTSGKTNGLDTSCAGTVTRQPFLTSPVPSTIVSLPEGDLNRLTGRWVAEGQPFEITVERKSNRLRMSLSNGKQFLLAPLSRTRFKVVGPPGFFASVREKGEEVERLEMEQGGAVVLSFVPAAKK